MIVGSCHDRLKPAILPPTNVDIARRPLIPPTTTVYGNGTAMTKSDQKALNQLSIVAMAKLPNDRFWESNGRFEARSWIEGSEGCAGFTMHIYGSSTKILS
jgi:hypothetical protein